MSVGEIYIVGFAKTNLDNPITKKYIKFLLAFVVDEKTNKILDFEMSAMFKITNDLLKKYLWEKDLKRMKIKL